MKEALAKLTTVVMKIKDMNKPKFKQVILVREDLKLPKGKMAAQVAHASVSAVFESQETGKKDLVKKWRDTGMMKIVLRVKDLPELKKYQKLAQENDLVAVDIADAGRTVVKSGTVTCLGIGPESERKIDKVTGELDIY
ncbi:peptidyl-tRNA hydrolase Pth2 [candidate division KSB1 bacterium]